MSQPGKMIAKCEVTLIIMTLPTGNSGSIIERLYHTSLLPREFVRQET